MGQALAHHIIRWQVQTRRLELEHAALTQQLAQPIGDAQRATLVAQIAAVERRQHDLGPNPAPKMG